MPIVRTEIRRGAYYDSVTLMQLQKSLTALPNVLDAGVVMGTPANQEILQQSQLLTDEAQQAKAEDLVIAIKADDDHSASHALAQVEALLAQRRSMSSDDYRPRSLEAAAQLLPNAQWVLVSVPGRYAAGVAREALRLGRHVFVYSDNVPIADEVALKREAREKNLWVLGPDCGTAIINGIGFGFANSVRRGRIGIIGASGTGIQTVASRLHQLGAGISHALGTGSHDLSNEVGAITTIQALHALTHDPETDVIVLISKPPSPTVAMHVLRVARLTGKPIVVDFIGYTTSAAPDDNLHFARTLSDAATLAVQLSANIQAANNAATSNFQLPNFSPSQKYLRGLYSGGTLAYEAMLSLRDELGDIYSNTPLDPHYQQRSGALALPITSQSKEHTIIDLGADEFMVGRLHPMLDHDLRIRRLRQEASDSETAIILLDVVLGYGAHPDPASELAPVIAEVRKKREESGDVLEVIVAVIGTDTDPQNVETQVAQLREAGAHVETDHTAAVKRAGAMTRALRQRAQPVIDLRQPVAAINVGLALFADSLQRQGASVVQVEWQPPAGGNEKLLAILARMKK
jgi:FdrA protein